MLRRIAKRLFDIYLYGNFHIALGALALALVTRDLFGYALRTELLVFIFCGTLSLYTMQRLPASFLDKNARKIFTRHYWNTQNRVMMAILTVINGAAGVWSYFQLLPRSQVIALIPAVISLAYAFPLLPTRKGWRRLRDVRGIKIYLISIVWGFVCVILPAAAAREQPFLWYSIPVQLWALANALIILALTIPFDVRDLYYDGDKLATLPALLGVRRATELGAFLLVITMIILVIVHLVWFVGTLQQVVAVEAWSLASTVVIIRSRPGRSEYYFSFVVDGMLILLGGMVLLVSYF